MSNLPVVVQNAVQQQAINPDTVNIILPTQTFGDLIGKYEKLSLEVVKINPDPEDGEVFEIKKGKKSFGKVALQKIANALGIIWDPDHTGIIESTSTKSRARATGAMRKPNGEWIALTEEKTVDLDAIEEEQQIKFEEDAEKGKITGWKTKPSGKKYPERVPWKSEEEKRNWINREVRKAVLSYKKFKDERAMTGAKERVIKALVAIKATYTDKELSKPFAFPRVILDASKMLENPETQKAAIGRMVGSVSAIFGESIIPEIKNVTGQSRTDTAMIEAPEETQEEETIPAESMEAPDEFRDEEDFIDDIPWDEPKESILKRGLKNYLDDTRLPEEAYNRIHELINNPHATEQELQKLTDRIVNYLERFEQRQKAKKVKV
ncbi:MAG: hypothetical protein JXB88_03205 [Spirochaetales bacterium]|nr:hypothetical protein [Spirochaetales bacterium]